ncbi:MAG: hypothetical protein MI864_09545 [Pseudomonadales bacterium]|nr:hypothetical protein [Pseudomonadales bacterium]
MKIPSWLERTATGLMDQYVAKVPQSKPDQSALEKCKVVSHRGEHDNLHVKENTIAAFQQAVDAGVWGIECDIRWTADLQPVICHDDDCLRVFNQPTRVADVTLQELQRVVPEIPTLAEVIDRFGKNTHLMLEVKAEPHLSPRKQKAILKSMLLNLDQVDDFHILALNPELFERVCFLDRKALLPVAELNFNALSLSALQNGYGGVTGHFLFLHQGILDKHRAASQSIGTGFIASKNGLFRELNRGVEWVFSNDAVKIQALRDQYLGLS